MLENTDQKNSESGYFSSSGILRTVRKRFKRLEKKWEHIAICVFSNIVQLESNEINANRPTFCSLLNVRSSTKIKKHLFLQYNTQEKKPKFRHSNKQLCTCVIKTRPQSSGHLLSAKFPRYRGFKIKKWLLV